MRNIRQNLFFAFVYNAARRAGRGGRALPVLRHPAVADHRRGGDGAVVGQRHRQRRAVADGAAVMAVPRPSIRCSPHCAPHMDRDGETINP